MVTTHSDLDSQNCTIQTKWNIALSLPMSRLGFKRPHVYCDNQRKEPVQLPTGIWGQIQLNLTLREPTRERGEQKYQLKAPAINKRASVIENSFDSNSQVL